MEPVRVACPHCRGKLVVRSEWLLGQTVVCPRCKSSVQIPKSGSIAGALGVVAPATFDSSAITCVDDGNLAQRLAQEPSQPGGSFDLDGQSFESTIEAFQPLHDDTAGAKSNSSTAYVPSVEEHGPIETVERDAIATSRMADWHPAETKRRRQLLLIAMAGIVATLVAVGGFIAFLNFHSVQNVVVQALVEPDPSVSMPKEAPVQALPIADGKSKEADDKSQVAIEPMPGQKQESAPSVAAPNEPVVSKTSEVPDNLSADLQSKSIEKILPDKNTVVGAANENSGSQPQSAELVSLDMPEAMKRFSQIFSPGSLTLLPDAIGTEKPTDGSEIGVEKIDIETLYHPSAVSFPTWEATQATQITRLATKDPIPLNQLLIVLGQLSGSGLGWDLSAVRLSGFDVDRPVTLSGQATSIGEVIKDFCAEHRLAVTLDGQELPRLQPIPEELARRLPTDWSLDDLATDESSLDAWREILRQLYPAWSNEWQIRGTELIWSESASLLSRATIAALFDQVRIAYGLKTKSTLPESVTDPRLGLDTMLIRLKKPGTRIIEHSMSVPQLLDVAARDAGLKLMFDWKSLSSHGLSHAKSATSLLRGRNWSEIAKWGLDEFSLVAVADGMDQVVITTLPQQRRMWRTLLLKLESGKTLESVRESLRMLSPTDDQGRSMLLVRSLPPVGDSSNAWVVVRLCPPNTFQLQTRVLREALRLPASKKS